MLKAKQFLISVALILLLSGCASTLPDSISGELKGNPEFSDVISNIEEHIDAQIRWGGAIVKVENRENQSWIEIVARELYQSGRPRNNDYSPGRFIAIVDGFIDPTVYAAKRQITVVGIVQQAHSAKIDQFNYLYPLVQTSSHHLWSVVSQQRRNYPSPYFYNRFYFGYPGYYSHRYHYGYRGGHRYYRKRH